MRKICLIIVNLIVFAISLSGCTHNYDYDFKELVNSAEQIYIVDVERTEYYGDISINYLMEIEEEFDDFLNQVSTLEYKSSIFLSPRNNTGLNIMIICNSGKYDYVLIGLKGVEEFKNDKQTYLYNAMCNEEDFDNLINKYYK